MHANLCQEHTNQAHEAREEGLVLSEKTLTPAPTPEKPQLFFLFVR
jgi:hypothetical protein